MLLKVITVKKYMLCHYCFFNRGFKFEDSISNSCHDFKIQYLNISDIAIITVKGLDYHCIIHDINKSKAIHLLDDSVLDDRGYI